MAFLVLVSSCESRKTIVNGLEEREANEILVFLSSKNIDAIKVAAPVAPGGGAKIALWDISVAAEQASDAMAILNAQGLPRRHTQNLLNLFQAGSLIPSEMQDRIRYQAGLAEQIGSTIRKIDGVLDAEVQLSFPEEDPLNPTAPKGKVVASVFVKHSGVLDDPNIQLVSKIKRLVASSVNGLDYDNVTVIGDRARFSETPTSAAGKANVPQPKLEYVRVWSVIVAKTSVDRFQALFFSFSVTILVLLLLLVWLTWKIFPIARKRGGMKLLFFLSPIPDEGGEKKGEGKKEEGKKEEPKDKTPPKSEGGPPAPPKVTVQENVETP